MLPHGMRRFKNCHLARMSDGHYCVIRDLGPVKGGKGLKHHEVVVDFTRRALAKFLSLQKTPKARRKSGSGKWNAAAALGSDERIRSQKSGQSAGDAKRRGRVSLRAGTSAPDTIDQIAKAAIVPGRAESHKLCEVPHIRAAESGAKVRARCISRGPHLAHARARLMPPVERVFVGSANRDRFYL
jgi:hypothetical protein